VGSSRSWRGSPARAAALQWRRVYALWLVLIVYLIVAARGGKRDTETHLSQSFALMFAIIAAFALPYLPIFDFVNFAPVSPVVGVIGIVVCLAGMVVFVSARQHLGRNWSQTVSAKEGHELVTSGRTATCGTRCTRVD
jgi:protein-S-isoprenylcysteine O-methyltransferase Ste14